MFIRHSTVTASVLAALAAANVAAAKPVTFANPTMNVITAVQEGPLSPGECTSYEAGDANAVLCMQEATLTAPDNLLLAGFLFNNGTAEICDLKLAPVNAPGLTAFWPDWAGAGASYEKYFNREQMTMVGLTTIPKKDGTMPSFEVVGMRACGPKEGMENKLKGETEGSDVLLSRKIPLADSPMHPPVEKKEGEEKEVKEEEVEEEKEAEKKEGEEKEEEEYAHGLPRGGHQHSHDGGGSCCGGHQHGEEDENDHIATQQSLALLSLETRMVGAAREAKSAADGDAARVLGGGEGEMT